MTLLADTLLSAAARGDHSAQERLLSLHARLLHGVAVRTLRPNYVWEVGDAVQSGSLALLHCARGFSTRGPAAFSTYAAAAALRACLRERRHYHRGWSLPERASGPAQVVPLDEERDTAGDVSPEEGALRGASLAALRSALSRLDESESAILALRYGLDGSAPVTLRQAAGTLGLPAGTVYGRERRALALLRAALEGDPE